VKALFRSALKWANPSRARVACGRQGLTILEFLLALAMLSTLMSLLLPAVQSSREGARNAQCVDHLHQVASALHAVHDSDRFLPAGWQPESTNESSYGWAVMILKELGEEKLYDRIDRTRPIMQVNASVRSSTPAVYLCPSDMGRPVFALYAELGSPASHAQASTHVLAVLPRANYMGVFGTLEADDVPGDSGDGVFIERRRYGFHEITRGLGKVVFVGERTTRKLASSWLGIANRGEDAAGRLVGFASRGPNTDNSDECEFDSRHPGHVNFAWADGRVASVSDDVDLHVYRLLTKRR
jgi:prepilin-type processing-associated H-X9-DG protein